MADAQALLDSMRLQADQKFFNHFEWVWLKQVPRTPEMHGYLTDCCLCDDPCDWHNGMEMANAKAPESIN